MGPYRAVAALGAPESGRVWRAEAADGGAWVVLRLDGPDCPAEALRRQFEIAGSLRHPHLVPTLDLIEDGEIALDGSMQTRSAVVVPFAEGGSLQQRLRDGPLEPAQLLSLLAGVAGALQACHERGLTHGDLTPARVLFSADGRPAVAGLGAVSAARELGLPTTVSPGYASPELARGGPPRAADDVFALGSIALECLTGRPAWAADDLRDVAIQSEFGQWPGLDRTDHPDVPAALSSLIGLLLAADPGHRPSADAVLRMLPGCGSPRSIDVSTLLGASSARHAAPDPVVELPPGVRWLDLEGSPGWAPEPASLPDRPAPRHVGGRWRASVVTLVVASVITAASIGAGLWWAGTDEPTEAVLADPIPTTTTVDPVSAAGEEDWMAVVGELDARRAAAFTSGDETLLNAVYVAGSAPLAADVARLRELTAAGYRVDDAVHVIESAQRLTGPDSDLLITVVDSMTSYPVRDESGEVVGQTVATDRATRTLHVVSVAGQGLRIVSVD